MKGREVRELLNSTQDPKLIHCIASIAEENSAINVEMHALAKLLDQITDVLGGITETMGEIKDASVPKKKKKKS
tara:strand:+ start:5027 stop:5248 length:222 start_codon:yes stop_codon:yes gene_type:complete